MHEVDDRAEADWKQSSIARVCVCAWAVEGGVLCVAAQVRPSRVVGLQWGGSLVLCPLLALRPLVENGELLYLSFLSVSL